MFFEELMRKSLIELIEVQTDRNRVRLRKEQADNDIWRRLIATSIVVAVLTHVWF